MRISSFARDRKGHFTTITALSLTAILATAGMSIDYLGASRLRADIQHSADAAALAAAKDMSLTDAQISTVAQNTFFGNVSGWNEDKPLLTSTVLRETKGQSGTVTVRTTAEIPATLLKVVGIDRIPIAATAVARRELWRSEACVFALDPSSPEALAISGSGTLEVPNCGIQVNSSATNALSQKGGGYLRAKQIKVVGTAFGNKIDPKPQTGQLPLADPLAYVPEPSTTAPCSYTNQSFGGTHVFPAGTVFCGTISFNGDITFKSGVHFFRNASVTTGASGHMLADHAMLYFDKNSVLQKSKGTGSVTLRAMTSGPYKGIAVFGSRETPTSLKTFDLYGDKSFTIEGAVYLPRAKWAMTGSSELADKAFMGWVVAWQLFYNGNATMVLDTYTGIAPKGLAVDSLALVE